MRLSSAWSTSLALLPFFTNIVTADRIFQSTSLDSCQSNSSFTASLFNIVFAPDNRTLSLNVVGESSVVGNVTFKVHANVYGYSILSETIDPCTLGLANLCPMSSIETEFNTIYQNFSSSIIGRIPSIAYQIPDLDAVVTVYMYKNDRPDVSLACLRAKISNGKTVDQVGVRWATAIISILGLIASGLVASAGFANTAAHMMVYTLSLFSYFQAVAIIGLCAVSLPPIVQSWTQDMSWSVGVINVHFLQRLARWYQVSTGGTPGTILQTLGSKSVQVAKRSIEEGMGHAGRFLVPRATAPANSGDYIVTGIDRLAFLEKMESTNVFMTGVIFYIILILFTVVFTLLFKLCVDLALRAKWIGPDSHAFHITHNGWRITFKGIVFRIMLIGYPPMVILCLWEFTQVDSPAEVFLAIVFLFGMTAALAYASFKVFRIAKRSEQIYKTAAFSLYADAMVLNKWGFLYVQFKASAHYYIVPVLIYTLIKGAFIGLGQKSGVTQAIALLMIEAFALIGASVFRPWMDKTTNLINISICVINFVNAIMLLIFTNVFNGPGLLIGVLGVVFFIANVVFALVLLLLVLFVVTLSFIKKNPESQYQPVEDNRASFIKSQTALNNELDELGATARGGGTLADEKYDMENHHMNSLTSHHARMNSLNSNHTGRLQTYHNLQPFNESNSRPITPTLNSPAFPPTRYKDHDSDSYRNSDSASARSNVESPFGYNPMRTASPALSVTSPRGQNMWQRGAGYT